MMEFEVGGIYKIVRKPLNRVKLYERKSDAGRHYYKYSMNAKILVISRGEKATRRRGRRCIAYFFKSSEIEHFVECLYGVWIKNMHFIKKERDISKWPHLARKHFLMAKGASVEAAIEGTLEDAHRQIANVARKTRIDKENKERQVKQAFDFDLGLRSNSKEMMYVTVDSSTTTGEVAKASPVFHHGTYETFEMKHEDPHDYDECYDEYVENAEEDAILPPIHSEPLPAPTGLAPGYMKQAKEKGKKLTKKKRKKRNQIPSLGQPPNQAANDDEILVLKSSQKAYEFGGYGKDKEGPGATTAAPAPYKYRSRSAYRRELKELAYGAGIDNGVRVKALEDLKEMDREDEEIRNTIKETKVKMEKKRSSFNAWYSDQIGKKEETE